jgi:hypothetical protein
LLLPGVGYVIVGVLWRVKVGGVEGGGDDGDVIDDVDGDVVGWMAMMMWSGLLMYLRFVMKMRVW